MRHLHPVSASLLVAVAALLAACGPTPSTPVDAGPVVVIDAGVDAGVVEDAGTPEDALALLRRVFADACCSPATRWRSPVPSWNSWKPAPSS